MTELETLQRAKMYLDKLANGIDPLTDRPVPEDDCVNQVRISRCLFYVSDVLRKLIENRETAETPKKIKQQPFAISQEALKSYSLPDVPINVSEITERINALIDQSTVKKLKRTSIIAFLWQCGLLTEEPMESGNPAKVPTDQGRALGILTEERQGKTGVYHTTVYSAEAQQFILDNIDAVAALNERRSAASEEKEKSAENQGQPWTKEQEEVLIELFRNHTPVSEIAAVMKRTQGGVWSRLGKLGLINKKSKTE